jgi:hypothetical protein
MRESRFPRRCCYVTVGAVLHDCGGAEPLSYNKVVRSFIKFKASSQSVIHRFLFAVCFEQVAKREKASSLEIQSSRLSSGTGVQHSSDFERQWLLKF